MHWLRDVQKRVFLHSCKITGSFTTLVFLHIPITTDCNFLLEDCDEVVECPPLQSGVEEFHEDVECPQSKML